MRTYRILFLPFQKLIQVCPIFIAQVLLFIILLRGLSYFWPDWVVVYFFETIIGERIFHI